MSVELLFEYYRDIIPDPMVFLEVVKKPLPICFWANTLKIQPDKLFKFLNQDGIEAESLAWDSSAFRSQTVTILGKRWEYLTGLLQIQEEVSMLPVMALDPKPGDVVLDMCAAPGNKTAQMAVAMKNQGTIIANDRNYSRLRALGQIMKRLGLVNVSTHVSDATSFPRLNGLFDKILVDAPCSCEGTFRKNLRKKITPSRRAALHMAAVQKALLEKAIRLCKPGGRILYSTCTFAPEENERVLHQILLEYGDQLKILPITLKGFLASPGIMEWKGEAFHPSVKNAWRIWPHINDTGGFFMALLEKRSDPLVSKETSFDCRPYVKSESIENYLDVLTERFGFPANWWASYHFSSDSRRGIYAVNCDNYTVDHLNIDARGLFFLKTKIKYPKLSTAAAMLLGRYATRHCVDLTHEQRDDYLQQKTFEITSEQAKRCCEIGYVIVSYQGHSLGLALYFPPHKDNPTTRLRSLFPKYFQGP